MFYVQTIRVILFAKCNRGVNAVILQPAKKESVSVLLITNMQKTVEDNHRTFP
jgi:hypothetical protein